MVKKAKMWSCLTCTLWKAGKDHNVKEHWILNKRVGPENANLLTAKGAHALLSCSHTWFRSRTQLWRSQIHEGRCTEQTEGADNDQRRQQVCCESAKDRVCRRARGQKQKSQKDTETLEFTIGGKGDMQKPQRPRNKNRPAVNWWWTGA